ncbi:MAG: hypothetical protein MUE42_02625 [Opitutaceae bacterium]|jgi:hypothetical protein|nr:hypothetical protein [Opitutaceae bacterium]
MNPLVLIVTLGLALPLLGARAAESAPTLGNPSFEFAGDKPEDVPAWGVWGGGIDRVDTWTPTRSGAGMIGYKHWLIRDAGDSGLFQDAGGVEAGAGHEFSVWIFADEVQGRGFGGVELRLESGVDGKQVTLASNLVAGADIPVGRWSRIAVRAVAPVDNLRVVIVFFPSVDGPRDGAVKIDDAQIVRLP